MFVIDNYVCTLILTIFQRKIFVLTTLWLNDVSIFTGHKNRISSTCKWSEGHKQERLLKNGFIAWGLK